MNRLAALLLAAVLLVGSVSAVPAAASAADTTLPASSTALQADANATNVTPGQRLAGVIGVGQAEFEGDVEQRAYGIEYALARSNGSRAAVVEERLETIRDRLDALEQRKEALREARENGTISEGEYRARVTTLAARGEQVRQLANASEARAESLPADVLEARGINVTAIRTLQADAATLTGQEVAEIAHGIAGPDVGRSVGGPASGVGRPGVPDAGPGDRGGDDGNESAEDARAAISEAQSAVASAEQRLERANERASESPAPPVADAIDAAEVDLERAQAAIDRAQAALDEGDAEAALEHAQDALEHAQAAEEHAQDAVDETDERGGQSTRTGDR